MAQRLRVWFDKHIGHNPRGEGILRKIMILAAILRITLVLAAAFAYEGQGGEASSETRRANEPVEMPVQPEQTIEPVERMPVEVEEFIEPVEKILYRSEGLVGATLR
jgi:flagellar basal body-associated protein FliL